MSHKVHPKIYRIKGVEDWLARGFYKKEFPRLLEEDLEIRKFLEEKLKDAGLAEVYINRLPGKLSVTVEVLRPGFVIGRGGENIEKLHQKLEGIVIKIRKRYGLKDFLSRKEGSRAKAFLPQKEGVKLEVQELRNPWIRASLVAGWIAEQFEKRTPFRRTIKRALEKTITNKEVSGARIEVSGRLDGNEIARREWTQKGQLPRQTLRSDIDYAQREAYCSYGVIGIKVWIYKGEKLD